MRVRPLAVPSPTDAFTLIEVVVASVILAIGLMGILLICSTGIRNARALERVHVDATSLAAEYIHTNKVFTDPETGDFGDFHPGYRWERGAEPYNTNTNGLFSVDFTVFSDTEPASPHSHLRILMFRPDSPQPGLR